MNIAEFFIKNKVLSAILIFLSLGFGWSAYKNMPRFEDPEFVIRVAQIIVQYPGASPVEVANEVTDPLEKAIQQLQEVELVESVSSDSLAELKVEIKYSFSKTKTDLQIIWGKLRNKVEDAARSLPPGVYPPIVYDDFGDVFGLYYFFTGEGFTPSEMNRYTKALKSDISAVDGVARIEVIGNLNEGIFVEISKQNSTRLGVARQQIMQVLEHQNAVVPAGKVDVGNQRLVIRPTGGIDTVKSIQNLVVTTSSEGKLIYLKDVAYVWRGYQTPPTKLV